MEPYVFVLDLDGTIIGDCTYQCDIYNIQDIITKNKRNNNLVKSKLALEKHLLDSYCKNSLLIRPHFTTFMSAMKRMYPNVHIFVYTASEKTWANKEINIIERQNNIKFNRPIFTRDDSIIDKFGNVRKSINKIMPKILRSIKAKKGYKIDNKLLVIDNNPTFVDYHDNFLLCPTYNYVKFTNIWDGIKEDYFKCQELKRYLNKLISESKIHYVRNTMTPEKQEKVYKWLYKKHKKINKYNCAYAKDTFWRDLTLLIKHNNIRDYNKKVILSMQKSIKS